MEFLIRFAQAHETFRQPEIEALASLAGYEVKFLYYDKFVRYVFLRFNRSALSLSVCSVASAISHCPSSQISFAPPHVPR